MQNIPAGHALHTAPPQSMPVSLPFFTPSVQVGGAQMPLVHTREVQSAAIAHCFPGAQAGQTEPPQSTSVSVPFLTPSAQIGLAHTPALHTRDAQSSFTLQSLPGAQGAQEGPPQSMSVSIPFRMPSAQDVARAIRGAPSPANTIATAAMSFRSRIRTPKARTASQ
jgi:hypothetical protein